MQGERLYKTGLRPTYGRQRRSRRRPRLLIGVSRQASDIDLLGYLNGVINLDAQIANSALNLRMPEQ